MSDLKCIKCESTETSLMSETIDGEEQRICMQCYSQKMEEDPIDAVVTIEVTTSPPSPGFKKPLALRTYENVDLMETNTEAYNVIKTSETNEECDGDGIVVVVDDDDDDGNGDLVVDEAMPCDNDLGSNNNNNNIGDDDDDVVDDVDGLESDSELKNEKDTNDTVFVVVPSEEKKEISTISKQETKDLKILSPQPPSPPPKDAIDVKAESELNQEQKQKNVDNVDDDDDDNKNEEHPITKEATPEAAVAVAATVENGTSLVVASATTTETTTSTTTAASASTTTTTTTTTTAAAAAVAKTIFTPPLAMPMPTITTTTTTTPLPLPLPSTITAITTRTTLPSTAAASTMQEPKAKPVPPTKTTSPTIIRRLRKSTRSTRFRSKMLASGNGSVSGAGNVPGPSGSQNHHSHHYQHASNNGSGGTGSGVGGGGGNHANIAASSSGKGQNKGGRSRRALFKRPAIKTPIMHATSRFVASVFFNGSYLQIGDIVSLVDSENMVYYAQIRGLLVDAYCEKSAFLSWLIPTQDSPDPKQTFDPATYLIGPDEDFSRKLSYLKFVMHAPSNYFHDRTTPFPLPDTMNPVNQPGGYIWTHLPMDKSIQDTELRTDD